MIFSLSPYSQNVKCDGDKREFLTNVSIKGVGNGDGGKSFKCPATLSKVRLIESYTPFTF